MIYLNPRSASNEYEPVMDISEVATYLGLDYFQAYRLLNNDKTLGYFKYGRKKVWRRQEIIEFKRRHFVVPTEIAREEV